MLGFRVPMVTCNKQLATVSSYEIFACEGYLFIYIGEEHCFLFHFFDVKI
jgi:hypothetical protein